MHRLTPILALALLCACGGTISTSTSTPPSPSPPSNNCTSSGSFSPTWALPQPASNPIPTIQSATVSGDTLKMTFVSGTPIFQVTVQSNAHFSQDPSGNPVNLAGTAGVRILLSGFRGFRPNYSGPTTLTSSGPLLLQVAELGDFEGYVNWGVGVSAPACANVTTSGSTLTFHFIKAPSH
jgi:hypothetical protein